MRSNVDPAFVRRLEFVVEFEEPGRDERRALWEVHLPPEAPVDDDVNLDDLADLYAVPGALIRNAAVAAAFLAAADGGSISDVHLVRAMRREYQKSGRAFPGAPAGTTA
jgi:SpoVK/Ycf46/Vps4 family AAA+-type ATPase